MYINIKEDLNVEFILPSQLEGKEIKASFVTTDGQAMFILTTDNEMAGYVLEKRNHTPTFGCDCDCNDDEPQPGIYEIVDEKEFVEVLLGALGDYYLRVFNVFKNMDAFEQELDRRLEEENRIRMEKEKQERYIQYLRLKEEFKGYKPKGR